MQGKIDRSDNVVIRFNIQSDKLLSPDHSLQMLPCEFCGAPHWTEVNAVSSLCLACILRGDELDCSQHAHSTINGACEC